MENRYMPTKLELFFDSLKHLTDNEKTEVMMRMGIHYLMMLEQTMMDKEVEEKNEKVQHEPTNPLKPSIEDSLELQKQEMYKRSTSKQARLLRRLRKSKS
ncbi:PREDICTED: uncharacterized protein LOC108568861 isoform X2 [Nicrophorus vespilloides]|nr:PREDICTED: uncharacterized protein LOC108568861 isoform X2 [Nicrophorus vespilloides]